MWKALHNKSEAKGTKRELLGAKTSPEGSQKGSKASQKATKMHQKIEVRKMSSKRQAQAQGGYHQEIWEQLWDLFL